MRGSALLRRMSEKADKKKWREEYLPALSNLVEIPIVFNGKDSMKAFQGKVPYYALGCTFFDTETDYARGIAINWTNEGKVDVSEVMNTLFHEIGHYYSLKHGFTKFKSVDFFLAEITAEKFTECIVGNTLLHDVFFDSRYTFNMKENIFKMVESDEEAKELIANAENLGIKKSKIFLEKLRKSIDNL